MNSKFIVFTDKKGDFRNHLKAENGEIILQSSEGYTQFIGCIKGIKSMKENALDDGRYERKTAKNDQYYFILKAGNGEPLGKSELYTSKQAMENGIDAVKRLTVDAPVYNETEEIIDLEGLTNEGLPIPHGKKFRLRVDKKALVWSGECITGRQILELAGKTPPERFQLVQQFRFGRTEVIELDEKVDLAACGVERFKTIPKGVTEGRPNRKDFLLSETDDEYLATAGYSFETVKEGNSQWLILRGLPIPAGYNVEKADVAILIPPTYPTTQLDMAYFFPALSRLDGRPIKTLSNQTIEGKVYQRWSRHRTAQNPWKPGEDDVSTHIAYMNYWLLEELKKYQL